VAQEGDARSPRSEQQWQRQEGYQIRFRAVTRLASASLLLACIRVARADEPAWRYEVRASAELRVLEVVATFAPGASAELSVDDGAEPFVRDVEVESDGHWQRVRRRDRSWTVPACARDGCRLRYRFMLADAADRLDSEVAGHLGAAIQAPPSTWLVHPIGTHSTGEYRFRVTMPAGLQFATGVRESADGADWHGSDVHDLDDAPYSVFGQLTTAQVTRATGRIEVVFVPGARRLSNAAVLRWIDAAASAIENYYGQLPLPRWLIAVVPSEGRDAQGRTLGNGGATILLSVGSAMTQADVDRDWVLTHEMVHLAFPSVARNQRWIEEGLATYVEPIARARVGQLPEAQVWAELVAGLPNGEPEPGDRGLDRTPTWGRTYWGGALFCFVADVTIRERTHNRRSLDDALRAIVSAGGTIAVRWPIAKVLEIGDRAVGVNVLRDLYARMATHPFRVNLTQLWQRLGVHVVDHQVQLDDRAPLAEIRRAITAPHDRASSSPQ
jgi:hypothetical protein